MPNLIWDGSSFVFLHGKAIQFKSQSCASRTLLCVHITSVIPQHSQCEQLLQSHQQRLPRGSASCIHDCQHFLQTQPWAPPPSKTEIKKPPTGLSFPPNCSNIFTLENTSSFFLQKVFSAYLWTEPNIADISKQKTKPKRYNWSVSLKIQDCSFYTRKIKSSGMERFLSPVAAHA